VYPVKKAVTDKTYCMIFECPVTRIVLSTQQILRFSGKGRAHTACIKNKLMRTQDDALLKRTNIVKQHVRIRYLYVCVKVKGTVLGVTCT
jgi:hypothetical protein